MDRIEMTQDALLDALQEAFGPDTDDGNAMTTREVARVTGWNVRQAREAIRTAVEAGVVEPVRVYRTAMDGRNAQVSAYRLKEAA